MMFGRAFSQHGEIGTASRCRGIHMLNRCYRVVHEVEAAPQKPLWREEACELLPSALNVAAGQVLGCRTKAGEDTQLLSFNVCDFIESITH